MTKRPRSAAVDISSFDDFLDTLAPSTSTSSSSTTTAGGMTTDSIAKLLHHNNSSSSSGEQSQSQQRPPLQQGEDPFLQRRRQPQRILGSSSSGSSAGTQRRRLPFGAAAAVAAPPTEPLTVEQQQAQVASEDLAAAFLAEGLRANAALTESDMKTNWEAAITSELAEHGCIGVRELYLNEGIADVAAWDLPLLSMPMYRFTAAPNSNKNSNAAAEENGEREAVGASPTAATMLEAHLQAHQLPSQTFTGLKKDVALDLLQMPVLPMNPLLRDEFLFLDNQRVTVKLVKTPEELRAERRQKLLEKQQQQRLEKQKQQQQEGGSSEETVVHTLSSLHQDRLNYRNLLDDKMSVLSSISPIAAENLIVQQKQERLIEHHRQNYDRHVAALPQQILKREADMWRHAEEDPQLCVYVVPSVKNADCVHRIRNFANDGCLRGFVLWVQDPRTAHHNGMMDSHVPPTASSGKDSAAASSSTERHVPGDVIIVLAGGRTAMRHLHRWITEKMRWHGATAEDASRSAEDASSDLIATSQRGRLVGSIRLLRVGDVSFLLPRPTETTAMEFLLPSRRLSRKQEHVFVRVAESWKDASSFLREQMPAASQYADLRFAWQNLFGLV